MSIVFLFKFVGGGLDRPATTSVEFLNTPEVALVPFVPFVTLVGLLDGCCNLFGLCLI